MALCQLIVQNEAILKVTGKICTKIVRNIVYLDVSQVKGVGTTSVRLPLQMKLFVVFGRLVHEVNIDGTHIVQDDASLLYPFDAGCVRG